MKNVIPEIGTDIPIEERQVTRSRDKSYVCRIRFETGRWKVTDPETNRGLLVFLRPDPDFTVHSHIRITEIQRSGRGVYAQPIAV